MTATTGLTAEQTKQAESKVSKMMTRLAFGTPMIGLFFLLVWCGHPYLVLLIVAIQAGLFRELVNVRYEPAKEKEVPLFRTIQWSMFALAMWQTYTKVFVKLGLAHSLMRQMPFLAKQIQDSIQYQSFFTFSAYVAMFMGFVLSLKKGLYQYQIGNAVWTVGVLMLIVYQIKGTSQLIFAGLFWFMLPCGLVVANDCFAYFCGMALGRRFIKAEFLAISPNKTWEGFIGAFFCTAVWAWFYSDWISRSKWFICPQPDLSIIGNLDCEPASIFTVQSNALPYDDYTLWTVQAKPVQLHAFVLSCFASVVAPFGGFLASAIKRAYNIKDFDALIPGHGGFMDRMDCQFLMLLCTYVHYCTFVRGNLQEEDLLAIIGVMPPAQKERFVRQLLASLNSTMTCSH